MGDRDEMQKKAALALAENKRLIVAWGTGVGKSRVAVRAVTSMLAGGKTRILLLVAQSIHKLNWRNEFMDALGKEEGARVFGQLIVECYDSLIKYTGSEFDLIVADEAHHLRSDKRTEEITSVKTEYFLCLTATMSDKDDAKNLLRALEMTFGRFVTMDFGIQDAIDCGILAEPNIYVHVLPLEKLEAPLSFNVTWGPPWLAKYRRVMTCNVDEFRQIWEKREEKEYSNIDCTVNCNGNTGYTLLSDMINEIGDAIKNIDEQMTKIVGDITSYRISGCGFGYTDINKKNRELKDLEAQKSRLNTDRKLYGSKRKKLMGEAKTIYSKWLLGKLAGKKFVCFCSTVKQCEELGGENIIHSKRKNNTKTVEAFNNGEIRSLFAVDMGKEGQNLSGIQAGVIIQLGGKERDFKQEFGRTMRSLAPEQHIIVINDTVDVSYYKNAIKDFNADYVHLIRYGEKRPQASPSYNFRKET